jgi:type I restriction enzyme S subunit
LDDKIELNRRINRTLDAMAQALFQQWVEANEDQATTYKVKDLIERRALILGDGYRAKRVELSEEGLPFARAGNLTDGFDFSGAELLGAEGIQAAKEKIAQDYDAVFTSKGTVGRLAQVLPNTPRFVYAPQLCYWRVLDRSFINPYVLFQWMKGREFKAQIDSMKGQTDMADYVSLGDQRLIEITLPLSANQTEVGNRLESLALRLDSNLAENRMLANLRDLLLPNLLSGEICVGQSERLIEAVL